MPLNNLPGWSYLSAGAFSLLPTESMAQKRANRQTDLYYAQSYAQAIQQEAVQRQQAGIERQKLYSTIQSMDVLQPDKVRLKGLVDEYRTRIAKIVKEEYGGDEQRFERERQPTLMAELSTEFLNNPLVNKAVQNKTNYGLYQAGKAKGLLAMPQGYTKDETGKMGYIPYENQVNEYFLGNSDSIASPDMIEFPKDVMDTFMKNSKAGAEYGVYNPKTKQWEAPQVTANELYDAVINKGYSPEKAAYISQFLLGDQIGKLRWNIKQESPLNIAKFEYQQKQDGIENRQRQQQIGISAMNAQTSRMRLNMDQLEKMGSGQLMGVLDKGLRNPESGILQGHTSPVIFPGMPNPNGSGNGIAGIAAKMPEKTFNIIKSDLMGLASKPFDVDQDGHKFKAVGKTQGFYSPNTGKKIDGDYYVTGIDREIIAVNDPSNPNGPPLKMVKGRIAIPDSDAYKKGWRKSNLGVFDSETKDSQGLRTRELSGGWTDDVNEYTVYLPIPDMAISQDIEVGKSLMGGAKGAPILLNNSMKQGAIQAGAGLLNSIK